MTGLELLAQAPDATAHLSRSGVIVMLASIGLVVALNIFCMTRILRNSPAPSDDGDAEDSSTVF